MCFNADVSIMTYIIGMIGCLRLWRLGYKVETMLYVTVIQMQLVDYLLWKNQGCNDTNKMITYVGTLINHFEPIAFWLAVKYFSQNKLSEKVELIMYIYIVASIMYSQNVLTGDCTTVNKQSAPHLYWKWNYGNHGRVFYGLFLICLIAVSIEGIQPQQHGYIHAGIITLSFVLSYIIYGSKHVVGGMWCFVAAFAPWMIPHLYAPPVLDSINK